MPNATMPSAEFADKDPYGELLRQMEQFDPAPDSVPFRSRDFERL